MAVFKPRARLIKIIGQELISNDVIALVELVKNSFDADATAVTIHLNDITGNNGHIIVEDNGIGMSLKKIESVWLEPATPDKRSKGKITYSKCFGRRYLGEKGIGRFAVHRLGNIIEMTTRASEDCFKSMLSYESNVQIDWNEFDEDSYLDKVDIDLRKISTPVVFDHTTGTRVTIKEIKPWSESNIKKVITHLRSLEIPTKYIDKSIKAKSKEKKDPGIKINIKSNETTVKEIIKSVGTIDKILKTAFYQFDATIDRDGVMTYKYNFNRPDVPSLKDSRPGKEDLKLLDTEHFSNDVLNNRSSPGNFRIVFNAWDLDTSVLKVANLATEYKNVIKPNTGVRIYRDGFRVWPYGDRENDDWLGLDLKRLNSPKERSVSRNQVIGFINISSMSNPKLEDQSNREGLIENLQYENFYWLVQGALRIFANERKRDKKKIDEINESDRIEDIVTSTISELRLQVEENKHEKLYSAAIDKVERGYTEKVNDILERYMMAAAIGISYSLPIHEMKLRLSSMQSLVESISENPKAQDKYLRELVEIVDDTQDVIKAVSSIMSRQRKKKVKLNSIAKNVKALKRTDFEKYGIALEIDIPIGLEVDAVPGLLNTAVLNIVDNSVYWLRARKIKEPNLKPKILITADADQRSTKLVIKDNGVGFGDDFNILTDPYYSRKSDGLGLGLFLVKEIMTRLDGQLLGFNEKGAVIELVFKN